MTQKLTKHHFKPGASFMYNTGDAWLPITIHKNCAAELIDFVIIEFIINPEDFRGIQM